MSTTKKNMPLKWYFSMKKKSRRIRIIENWHWKSEFCNFWRLLCKFKYTRPKIFLMGSLLALSIKDSPVKFVQLNLHETDLLFRYLSHHLTWHCLLIYGFPPFFPVLVCCDHKIVLHWYENQNKNNLVIMLRKSWEILGNPGKSSEIN